MAKAASLEVGLGLVLAAMRFSFHTTATRDVVLLRITLRQRPAFAVKFFRWGCVCREVSSERRRSRAYLLTGDTSSRGRKRRAERGVEGIGASVRLTQKELAIGGWFAGDVANRSSRRVFLRVSCYLKIVRIRNHGVCGLKFDSSSGQTNQ